MLNRKNIKPYQTMIARCRLDYAMLSFIFKSVIPKKLGSWQALDEFLAKSQSQIRDLADGKTAVVPAGEIRGVDAAQPTTKS